MIHVFICMRFNCFFN